MLGTLETTDEGRCALRFERHLAHPPAKVWRAISDPEELRAWYPVAADLNRPPGTAVALAFTRVDLPDSAGVILRCDPPRLLEYSWDADVIRFELADDGNGGCVLVFTNVFDFGREDAAPVDAGAAWHAALEVLEARLDGVAAERDVFERATELGPDYAAAFRSGAAG
ncbi:uncharacterized protein YndB with AHSA1/START domain [Murinocardiopsis flavida]|uniref:Uncharacterized protein YndB with AHSA1/START domain n=1 Tax=Murinocardiopsis flavida TaxID=645275 RepID=A0A2P8CF19_9ACTN|nr:SRPBCC family protein [Murinocardiopsis flavida]PSK83561.1 uncharacterized protein YndB with AHSA1/START domain [Murinocardiopsis flavida]